jgi:hypothetical protein
MKIFVIFALFALANCQTANQTVTDELMAAQAELSISHEFAELLMLQNRERLSNYLEQIEQFTLDTFLTAYGQVKTVGIDTRRQMDEFEEPSFCKDRIRARWELQVTRYGQKLSQCLATTHRLVKNVIK